MKIILLKDIKNLGRLGEILEVKSGYARNFLIPRHLARLADLKSVEEIEKRRDQERSQEAKAQAQAEKLATSLKSRTFGTAAAADEKGHLYAGLKETAILAKIRESEPGLPIETKLLDYVPIKELGSYVLKVRIRPGAEAVEINLQVTKA